MHSLLAARNEKHVEVLHPVLLLCIKQRCDFRESPFRAAGSGRGEACSLSCPLVLHLNRSRHASRTNLGHHLPRGVRFSRRARFASFHSVRYGCTLCA